MDARIGSIRLIKCENGFYWLITLVDDNENIIGTFGNEKYCSDMDFRTETFYIMKILNNWDLLNLDGQKKSYPILVDNEFFRIDSIANADGEYLRFDHNSGEVIRGNGCDVSSYCQRNISKLESRSSVFMASITDDYSHRAVMADLAYFGFEPLYGSTVQKEKEELGATNFRTFVVGILELCNVNELIQSHNYPEVSINFDSDNNIIGIGTTDKQECLCISPSGYELVGRKRIK